MFVTPRRDVNPNAAAKREAPEFLFQRGVLASRAKVNEANVTFGPIRKDLDQHDPSYRTAEVLEALLKLRSVSKTLQLFEKVCVEHDVTQNI